MTALGIGLAILAALVAIGIGWAYAGRQATRERRTREQMEHWQYPSEAELDAAGERVQDYIRVLGEAHDERVLRLRGSEVIPSRGYGEWSAPSEPDEGACE